MLVRLRRLDNKSAPGLSVLSVQSYKKSALQASGMVIKNQLCHAVVTNSRQ
jgi:hypothetical protein